MTQDMVSYVIRSPHKLTVWWCHHVCRLKSKTVWILIRGIRLKTVLAAQICPLQLSFRMRYKLSAFSNWIGLLTRAMFSMSKSFQIVTTNKIYSYSHINTALSIAFFLLMISQTFSLYNIMDNFWNQQCGFEIHIIHYKIYWIRFTNTWVASYNETAESNFYNCGVT